MNACLNCLNRITLCRLWCYIGPIVSVRIYQFQNKNQFNSIQFSKFLVFFRILVFDWIFLVLFFLIFSQSVEPGGASHATGVSAEWPSLIGESANQLKMEMFFRTKILDIERKHFANGTIKFGEAWARRLSTRIEQRIQNGKFFWTKFLQMDRKPGARKLSTRIVS